MFFWSKFNCFKEWSLCMNVSLLISPRGRMSPLACGLDTCVVHRDLCGNRFLYPPRISNSRTEPNAELLGGGYDTNMTNATPLANSDKTE